MCLKTQRILLIERDNSMREMMQLCLETIPHCEVITVNSVIKGIETASVAKIDAILLDLDETIPDLIWQEIVRDLSQNPLTHCIPLILLTTTPLCQELLQLQQLLPIKAIAKSFDLLNLASQVSLLLDWN
ncbi:MAG TPA: response regulator [Xenococcaceae cyanobacterium]|jgi:CheY-like chemotaxis protein